MRNKYHIDVKECCASCQHKDYTEVGDRICLLSQMFMESGFRCSRWGMSEGLQNAGKSGGVVRLKGTLEILIK